MMLCEDSSRLCSGLSRGCSGDALGVLRDVSGQRSGGSQGTDLLHTISPPPPPSSLPPAAGREPGTLREGENGREHRRGCGRKWRQDSNGGLRRKWRLVRSGCVGGVLWRFGDEESEGDLPLRWERGCVGPLWGGREEAPPLGFAEAVGVVGTLGCEGLHVGWVTEGGGWRCRPCVRVQPLVTPPRSRPGAVPGCCRPPDCGRERPGGPWAVRRDPHGRAGRCWARGVYEWPRWAPGWRAAPASRAVPS